MPKKLVIAIDGPAGAGKSSSAKALAKRLGYRYLDSGALYRAVAWKLLQLDIPLSDDRAVEAACGTMQIKPVLNDTETAVWVDQTDVTPFLRRPQVTAAASRVASIPAVRKRLLSVQRGVGRGGGIVAEGRDIGTVVFPDADVKFYLDADLSVRGKRRLLEAKPTADAEEAHRMEATLRTRDLRDSRRSVAPLTQGADAIRIDSTHLTLKEVVDAMFGMIAPMLTGR